MVLISSDFRHGLLFNLRISISTFDLTNIAAKFLLTSKVMRARLLANNFSLTGGKNQFLCPH